MMPQNVSYRLKETLAIKSALSQLGINAVVNHGNGTARGWLNVYVGDFEKWSDLKHVNRINNNCPLDCPLCTAYKEIRNDVSLICLDLRCYFAEKILVLNQNFWRKNKENIIKQEKWLAQFKARMGIS